MEVFFKEKKIRNCEYKLVTESWKDPMQLKDYNMQASLFYSISASVLQRSCLNNGPWPVPHLKNLPQISKVQMNAEKQDWL